MIFSTYDTVDLFAGPGGWSLAAYALGLREMGIELDPQAHATRRAAGFHTIRASVLDLTPMHFPNARGLIASPPCQTFSPAGNGAGRRQLDVVLQAMADMADGIDPDPSEWSDPRTALVVEPLRWALEAHAIGQPYAWIALEQVATVLPVWEAMAHHLRAIGYQVVTANLQAEQYGVAQTRRRAVLMARYQRPVSLPQPTHSKFYSRNRSKLDPGVEKWVSMAEALGWGAPNRPAPTVMGGGAATGGAEPWGPRTRRELPLEAGYVQRSNYSAGGPGTAAERGRTERHPDEPSVAITSKGFQWAQVPQKGAGMLARAGQQRTERLEDEPSFTITGGDPEKGGNVRLRWAARFGNQEHSAVRSEDEPAATIRYGARVNAIDWLIPAAARFGHQDNSAVRSVDEPAATIAMGHDSASYAWQMMGAGASHTDGQLPRDAETEPAHTITGKGTAAWVHHEPAPTVAGDPRLAPHGCKHPGPGCCANYPGTPQRQFGPDTVRVSVEEAAVLQSFPPDYPWQGNKGQRHQQVGNAIPPLLAYAILQAVVC